MPTGVPSPASRAKTHINLRPEVNVLIELLVNHYFFITSWHIAVKTWKCWSLNCSSGGVCSHECTVWSSCCFLENDPVCHRQNSLQFLVRKPHLLAGIQIQPRTVSSTDSSNQYFNPLSASIFLSLITFAFAFPEKTFVYYLRIHFAELMMKTMRRKQLLSILLTWYKSCWSQHRNSSLALVNLGFDHFKHKIYV